MSNKNYTPIDDLIKNTQSKSVQQKWSKPKEAEPLKTSEGYEIEEVVEHEAEKEVQPYVQVKKEMIEVPEEIEKVAIKSPMTPKFASYQKIILPISDDKVVTGLHAPITSSLRWLATLAIYILRKAHMTLKVIHGKVVRVIKN